LKVVNQIISLMSINIGNVGHYLVKDERIELINGAIKKGVAGRATQDRVRFISGTLDLVSQLKKTIDKRKSNYSTPSIWPSIRTLQKELEAINFVYPEKANITQLFHFHTKDILNQKLHNLKETAQTAIRDFIDHFFGVKNKFKLLQLSVKPVAIKRKKNRKTTAKEEEKKRRKTEDEEKENKQPDTTPIPTTEKAPTTTTTTTTPKPKRTTKSPLTPSMGSKPPTNRSNPTPTSTTHSVVTTEREKPKRELRSSAKKM